MKNIVFDMDGVLFDTEQISYNSFKEVAEEKDLPYIESVMIGCIGKNRVDILEHLWKSYGKNFPAEDYLKATSKRCREIIEREGLPLKSGVREILEYLLKNGYKVGLASSSSKKTILSHLEKAGLIKYFAEIIGGDMVEHSKPLPDIYVKACEMLGVKPEETIAIEDSPNGIKSSYAAGMKPIMIPDMVEPSSEITKLLYKKFSSLSEAMQFFIKMEQQM